MLSLFSAWKFINLPKFKYLVFTKLLVWVFVLVPIGVIAQEPIFNMDSAIAVFSQQTRVAQKTKTAFWLGENFWSIRKLKASKYWLAKSLALTPVATDSNDVVNALHLLANVYINEAVYDSALFFCDKAFTSIAEISNKYLLANLYQTKGRIFMTLGDQLSAVNYFSIADSLYLSSPHSEIKAISPYIKISLGQLFERQHRMDRAKEYFDLALQLAESQKSLNAKASALQTIAEWHCSMKQYRQARDLYLELLRPPLLNSTSYRMIYIYTGLGDVYLDLNKPDSSMKYYRMGMRESIEKGEEYLRDIIYCKIGDVHLKLGNTSLAKLYYDSTLLWGKKNKNGTYSIKAYQNLAAIAIIENDYKKAFRYQELKQQLNDSVLNLKSIEMSNNLYTLNNIKQKDASIITLTALDNDNRKIIRQGKVINYLLYGFMGLLVVSFFVIFNRVKLTRQIEKQQAITLERERIITDLHDDVGATISSMHIYSELAGNMVEMKPDHSKEMMNKISQQGKDLLGRMSDIIWSLKPAGEEKYSLTGRLTNYSQELLAAKEIKTIFHIDESLNNKITNPALRKTILLIAKEAMNNIAKYSGAATATIVLQQTRGYIELSVQDDGAGFNTNVTTHGNGLNNMRQRSLHIKGSCNIISAPGNGTHVHCKFPIANISSTS